MVRLTLVSADNIDKNRRLLNSSDKKYFRVLEVENLNYKLNVGGEKKAVYEINDGDIVELEDCAENRRYVLHSYVYITSLVETDYRRSIFVEDRAYRALRGKLRNASYLSDTLTAIKSRNFSNIAANILHREHKRLELLCASLKAPEQQKDFWKSFDDLDISALYAITERAKEDLRNEILKLRFAHDKGW